MFLEPLSAKLLEKRLQQVGSLAGRGIIGAESPVMTEKARALVRAVKAIRPMARQPYRFVWNRRVDHRGSLKLVPMAALFVYHLTDAWPHQMVLWLRRLGDKLGLSSDHDGPYVLLAGIRAVLVTAVTLAFVSEHSFPR